MIENWIKHPVYWGNDALGNPIVSLFENLPINLQSEIRLERLQVFLEAAISLEIKRLHAANRPDDRDWEWFHTFNFSRWDAAYGSPWTYDIDEEGASCSLAFGVSWVVATYGDVLIHGDRDRPGLVSAVFPIVTRAIAITAFASGWKPKIFGKKWEAADYVEVKGGDRDA